MKVVLCAHTDTFSKSLTRKSIQNKMKNIPIIVRTTYSTHIYLFPIVVVVVLIQGWESINWEKRKSYQHASRFNHIFIRPVFFCLYHIWKIKKSQKWFSFFHNINNKKWNTTNGREIWGGFSELTHTPVMEPVFFIYKVFLIIYTHIFYVYEKKKTFQSTQTHCKQKQVSCLNCPKKKEVVKMWRERKKKTRTRVTSNKRFIQQSKR